MSILNLAIRNNILNAPNIYAASILLPQHQMLLLYSNTSGQNKPLIANLQSQQNYDVKAIRNFLNRNVAVIVDPWVWKTTHLSDYENIHLNFTSHMGMGDFYNGEAKILQEFHLVAPTTGNDIVTLRYAHKTVFYPAMRTLTNCLNLYDVGNEHS